MSFLKNLFGKKQDKQQAQPGKPNSAGLQYISTDAYFAKRFQDITDDQADMMLGSIRMVGTFLIDKQLRTEENLGKPNSPEVLDEVVQQGFMEYCRERELKDGFIITSLAFALSEHLIEHLGMRLYSDKEPEEQLRGFTLKKDAGGSMLSAYPLEYSLRVLEGQRTFSDLVPMLKEQEEQAAGMKDRLDDFLKS